MLTESSRLQRLHGTVGQLLSFHPLVSWFESHSAKKMSNGEGGGAMPEKSTLLSDLIYKTALYSNLGIDLAQNIFNTLP